MMSIMLRAVPRVPALVNGSATESTASCLPMLSNATATSINTVNAKPRAGQLRMPGCRAPQNSSPPEGGAAVTTPRRSLESSAAAGVLASEAYAYYSRCIK